MEKKYTLRRHMTPFRMIIFGFAAAVLSGALLLMLPVSSQEGVITAFPDTLFTATSAVCVTGLVVRDTASYWSAFGQAVILILIQIGGMGVITMAVFITVLSGRKISLMQRTTMQETMCAQKVGGIIRMTNFVIKGAVIIEGLGALLMIPVFIRREGVRGIWLAVFHSVSAFCNAGFDLLGTKTRSFVSLTAYAENPLINLVIMGLIIIGGLGFLTWEDIYTHRWHLRRYRMQSKVILFVTILLISLPAIYFYMFEFTEGTWNVRMLKALFQAVTPRTAGFNTVDLRSMTGAGRMLIIILMLIGGAPGSTAGGMKVTTIAVLYANLCAVFARKESPRLFGRRISQEACRNAAAVQAMYMTLFAVSAWIISVTEGLDLEDCLFECASAVGTVGLSLGITTRLGLVSRLILIALMFIGRVGGLTLIYAALRGSRREVSKMPVEKITVG